MRGQMVQWYRWYSGIDEVDEIFKITNSAKNSQNIENLFKLFHNLESRFNDLNNKSGNTLTSVLPYLTANNSREKLIAQSEFNKVISKIISKTNNDVKCLMLATSAYVQRLMYKALASWGKKIKMLRKL